MYGWGVACMGEDEHKKFCSKNFEKRDNFVDIATNGKVLLKEILDK
jgi:hypothetical protein